MIFCGPVRLYRFKMFRELLILLPLLGSAFCQYHLPVWTANRTTLVHLFEWKWTDIALECERFLGPEGYAGVQVSPPNENALILEPFRPWWERYQPVSFKLDTRSGNEAQFSDMVRRCNSVGVRIIVDAVPNHMTHFSTVGVGTGGSNFNSDTKEYPAVPFVTADFHTRDECPTESGQIEDHLDPIQSRMCEMGGLRDLNQGRTSVREKIVEYMNKLIGFGVAGFRIDSAKQQWPEDLQAMFASLTNLPTQHGFPPNTRPFIFQEIIILDTAGEPIKGGDYFPTGQVTELKYGMYLGEAVRGRRTMSSLSDFGEPQGMYPSNYAIAFTDNHDNQRNHGAGGDVVVSHMEPRLYKVANAFMLAWPYGQVKVMSSYEWSGQDSDSWVGPPNTDGVTDDVVINPDTTCGNGWICEHRWRQIKHMTQFRNIVEGTVVENWWDNGNNQIAFCRGDKGFIAINNEGSDMNVNLQTCLPSGTYCDIITGDIENGQCTGRVIRVALGGMADISISGGDEELVVATHVQARVP